MHNSAAEIQFLLNTPPTRGEEELPKDVRRHAVGCLPRVAHVMALAIQFQDMIQRGESRITPTSPVSGVSPASG